ncbi:MAG: glycogen debranching protein GlgX, partial [Actinomycetaceae bacterium]|nr:glycogen debranching protein GlgX [Actinomycetaceae bacterium]
VEETQREIKRPYIHRHNTVIYEAHVKGFTQLLGSVPEEERGTYKGFAHPSVISYIKDLGVTSVELLPIHAKMDEPFLRKRGLTNYWGYNTLAYFAPEPSYATVAAQQAGGAAVIDEVKAMVDAYHDAGLEIILDVVYNHTCEGDTSGVTVSWRGIDQSSYYMSDQHDPSCFLDTTGCGNSLDFRRQSVIKMALDSLRYWVQEIGVDGFRFDLATTLGRNGETFDSHHPFYMALVTDPILSTVKLINEPWDIGPMGWQTGNFPGPTCDWNDLFRDSVREFWLGSAASAARGEFSKDMRDFATRLAGSADLFGLGRAPGGRGPIASINFVTAHDGFTLRDLVSYNAKHNEMNGENNRDGTDNNRSWNHGVEGQASGDVERLRRRSMRNLLGTLVLSAGTPMLVAGDEFGRTQGGNNNSYCQDNEISWVNWEREPWQEDMRETLRYLLNVRARHEVFRPEAFYTNAVLDGDEIAELAWFDAFGELMPDYCWFDPNYPVLQMLRSGFEYGEPDVLIVFNRSSEAQAVTLPHGRGTNFELVWDSAWERPRGVCELYAPAARTRLDAHSMRLFLSN